PDGDESAPGDALEESRLPGREHVFRLEPGDGGHHVGVHVRASRSAAMRHGRLARRPSQRPAAVRGTTRRWVTTAANSPSLEENNAMRFGLLYEAQRPFEGTSVEWNALYKETLEQCVLADRVGFDNLWFVEHHFLTGFSGSPCPEVLLGALSQLTRRIRIGFGVSILPAHHPIHVAERAAMLDQLTDGRLEFGTGRSNAYEQLGQGVDPRETRAMWEESLTMLPQIWQSDEF